jgi:hypothetical protein
MSGHPVASHPPSYLSLFFSEMSSGDWIYSARDQFGNEVFSDWSWKSLEDAMQGAYRMVNAHKANAVTAAPPATGQLPPPRARRRDLGK